jgi:hypothetical protein
MPQIDLSIGDAGSVIAAAISQGGTLEFGPPGAYSITAPIVVTTGTPLNYRPIRLSGYGVTLTPTGPFPLFRLRTDHNPSPGAILAGWDLTGEVEIRNAGLNRLVDTKLTGLTMISTTPEGKEPKFAEANRLDHVLIDGGIGIRMVQSGTGTGSFAESHFNDVLIRNCVTGVTVAAGANIHRSLFAGVTVWVPKGGTGFFFDGNLDEAILMISAETSAGKSGVETIGIEVGPNATQSHHQAVLVSFTGTGPDFNRLKLASGKSFPYREGERHAGVSLFAGDWWDVPSGPVLKSPNGTRFMLTISNDGVVGAQ